MAKDITIKNVSGNTIYYPKTVSDLVYDNESGETVKQQLDKKGIETNGSIENDFEITDENNYAIVNFKDGHIKTKNFDSSNVATTDKATTTNDGLMSKEDKIKLDGLSNIDIGVGNEAEVDFSIQDESKYAIVNFKDGHIKTKNFDSSNVYNKDNVYNKEEVDAKIEQGSSASLYPFITNDKSNYTFIHVGNDYTFKHPQEAINSITDASVDKQYMVVLHDDIYINSLNQLYKQNGSKYSTSEPYNSLGAYIWLKNYVNLMGVNGRQVKIEVMIPDSEMYDSNNNFRESYVHCVYGGGSIMLKDLYFKCRNTRYCIHQENGSGKMDGWDSSTFKRYINLKLELLYGLSVNYINAMGVGTAPNLRVYMENCTFISHRGGAINGIHTHPNYDYPCEYHIKNCRFIGENANAITNQGFSDLASGQKHKFVIEGCEMTGFNISKGTYTGEKLDSPAHDVRNQGLYLSGHDNNIILNDDTVNALTFTSTTKNDISVDTTSSASSLIFGDVYKKYLGVLIGTEFIYYRSESIKQFSLSNRLGNCSTNNKVLRVSADGSTATITFDKDYSSMSEASIIAEMNTALSGIGVSVSTSYVVGHYYFDDEVMTIKNSGTAPIKVGDAVMKTSDFGTGQVQTDNNKVIGIAAERIDPNEMGAVIIRGKQKIVNYNTGFVYNNLYKFVNNTIVSATNESDADLICTYKQSNGRYILEWI